MNIRFQPSRSGNFAYLSSGGGLDVETVLGGCGTHLQSGFGGFQGRALRAGDRIAIGPPTDLGKQIESLCNSQTVNSPVATVHWSSAIEDAATHKRPLRLRLLKGVHFEWLTESSQQMLLSERFFITPKCSRIGFRLDGPPLRFVRREEIPSMPTTPGTVQLPIDGSPMVLMADAAPTGGYPQIGYVVAADLPALAQAKPGTELEFVQTNLNEAYAASARIDQELRKLAVGIQLRL